MVIMIMFIFYRKQIFLPVAHNNNDDGPSKETFLLAIFCQNGKK